MYEVEEEKFFDSISKKEINQITPYHVAFEDFHKNYIFMDWLNKYMGKDYGGSAYEIVSMGFEMAYTDIKTLMQDEEFANFIFGILTLL